MLDTRQSACQVQFALTAVRFDETLIGLRNTEVCIEIFLPIQKTHILNVVCTLSVLRLHVLKSVK